MTGSGVFPKVDGDVLYSKEVNHFFSKIAIINTSGLNVITSSGSAINTLGSITPSVLTNYAKIKLIGKANVNGVLSGTSNSPVNLKIEVAQAGSSYSTVFDDTIFGWNYTAASLGGNTGWNSAANINYEYLHTLTSGQQVSGLIIQVVPYVINGATFTSGITILEWA